MFIIKNLLIYEAESLFSKAAGSIYEQTFNYTAMAKYLPVKLESKAGSINFWGHQQSNHCGLSKATELPDDLSKSFKAQKSASFSKLRHSRAEKTYKA